MSNPAACLMCYSGFYLNNAACTPCNISSNCMQCSSNAPSTCLSCYPGSNLVNGACQICTNNCASCSANNTASCTSCYVGFVLMSNNTCANATSANSACGTDCATCVVSASNTSTCSLCNYGTVLISGSCVPCQAGCSICSNANFATCLTCFQGYYTNSTGGCSMCSSNCMSCSSLGCTACQYGYVLGSDFKCTQSCSSPCATCTSPTSCLSCLYGFASTNSSVQNCAANVATCNSNRNCQYCPMGYVLVVSNTNTTVNQTCLLCNTSCARCMSTNINTCTACMNGTYLNTNSNCVSCTTGCSSCISLKACFSCMMGYIPQVAGSITAASTQIVSCVACMPNCASCVGSISTCLACATNYNLQGTQCVSSFNFQAQAVLNTLLATFNQNYLAFLTQVANAAGTSIGSITVLSIVNGSVTVTMLISTQNSPNSNSAASQQTNIQNALTGSIAGMPVTSSLITSNGGSADPNNSADSGLSKTTIIILATVIPVGTLRTSLLIQSSWE